MPTTTRLALRYPLLSDTADVPRDIGNLASDIDNAAIFGTGTLAGRPVSAGGSPGISGRFYYANDLGIGAGHLYFDYSQGWRKIPMYQTDGTLWMRSADSDTQPAIKFTPSAAKIEFGAGGSSAVDTNLYRWGVNQLGTDSSIRMTGTAPQIIALGVSTLGNFLSLGQTGDAAGRFILDTNGKQYWGSGSSATDTTLYRSSAGTLKTDGAFIATGSTSGSTPFQTVWGNGNSGFIVDHLLAGYSKLTFATSGGTAFLTLGGGSNGIITWSGDTNLYRSSAGVLKTDTSLIVGSLGVSGYGVYVASDRGFNYNPASAVGTTLTSQVNGAGNPLLQIDVNGKFQWGAGGASAVDTNLYRFGAATLQTDGSFVLNGGVLYAQAQAAGSAILRAMATGDSQYPFVISNRGAISWGSGAAVADVTLSRTTTKTLGVDHNFKLGTDYSGAGTMYGPVLPVTSTPVTDADVGAAVSGLMVVDTTNSKLWVRVGSTWKGVVLT